MSTVLDQIISHLEFLGYEIEQREGGIIKANHQLHANFLFHLFGFGFMAKAMYGVNTLGKSHRSDFLERLNAYNGLARVSRAYVDKDFDLAVEAVFPNYYDKAAFGTFMESYNDDMGALGYGDLKLSEYLN